MKNPRLAIFNTQPPHLYFGGVERRIIETGKRQQNEVDITIYCGTKAGFKKPLSFDGMNIVPCFSTDFLFPVDNWFFNHTLVDSKNALKADVYEAHNASGYELLKSLKNKNHKASFIETVHGILADEYLQTQTSGSLSPRERLANLLMGRLARLEGESARNASLMVTVSNYSAEKAVRLYGVDEAKIRVVPNGVDPDKFKPSSDSETMKRKLGIGNKPMVLFVGRLIPRKGLMFLVEAAKRIVNEYTDTIFAIVGNGPLRNKLTSQLDKAELSKSFLFLGDVKDSILPAVYNCADVFAFPSIQEGQGIALLEAQASAKPVVAFNVGGINETVADGNSGSLVERGNTDELAEAILKILSNPSLRERMGKKGREFVLQNFTWDLCAKTMLVVYHEALSI